MNYVTCPCCDARIDARNAPQGGTMDAAEYIGILETENEGFVTETWEVGNITYTTSYTGPRPKHLVGMEPTEANLTETDGDTDITADQNPERFRQ